MTPIEKNDDLIRRGDVLKIIDGKSEFWALMGFADTVDGLMAEVNAIPAVPQPMSAVEYIHTFQRMCSHIQCCPRCPLYGLVCGKLGSTISDIDKAVVIVEKWVQEHPEEMSEEE